MESIATRSAGRPASVPPAIKRATSALPLVAISTRSSSATTPVARAAARFERGSRAPETGLSLPKPILTPAARKAATSAVAP